MNIALVMIGSNQDADEKLALALEKLTHFFSIDRTSHCITSEPVGEKYKSPFYNRAVRLITEMDYESTISRFKQIEKELGRTPESKSNGLIAMDIDLICWNGAVIHKDYDRFPFVKICIDEITPQL
jgi:2-amino-4-hydroxy-6-hydroxymethyldihydropteridine diphosphokinase